MKKIYFFLIALLLTLSAGAQTLRGDVNGDGTVDVADVTELVDIILNGDEEEPDTPAVPEEPATDSRAIDLGLPSGIKWASCNVGATEPWEYGGYYAWGETQEKSTIDWSTNDLNTDDWSTYKYCNGSSTSITKYCTDSSYGIVDNKTTLEPDDDVAHVKWGGSWRMPTTAEQDELRNNCTWQWSTLNGVNGYRVTGPNGNSIFLPAAGFRSGVTGDFGQGSWGQYWSGSLHSFESNLAYGLTFDSYSGSLSSSLRYSGYPVRPVCDDATETPVVNYTVTVSSSGNGTVAINGTSGTTATIKEGDNVTITATPGSGEEFAGWYTDGGETLVSTEATYTFVASANVALIAKFNTKPDTDSRAIDLGLPSGIKWASCNVGATEPEEYGGYYAWGETEEKNEYSWSTYKYCNGSETSMTKYCTDSDHGTVDNKTTLEPGDDVATVKWGGSWRMPTRAEQDELRDNCTWTWTTLNGVNGYRVTGPNGNSIFLPAAGYRFGTEVDDRGSSGYYWSSTLRSDYGSYYSSYACYLDFDSRINGWDGNYRYNGRTVRPVCE